MGVLLANVVVFGQPTTVSKEDQINDRPLRVILSETTDGRLLSYSQSVFGPKGCVNSGDPFSPLESPWTPQLYTYRYQIHIPSDYEQNAGTDIVRVELFDPDSINTNTNSVIITHTQQWISSTNQPETESAFCESSDHTNSCIINTGELQADCDLIDKNNPHLYCDATDDIFLVNPYWFVRVDENLGPNCAIPNGYTSDFNTATLYKLYYLREVPDGTLVHVPLANYTGQVGNPMIDMDSNHRTDLKWVAPGAYNEFGEVPTNCSSPNGGSNLSDNPSRCIGVRNSVVANDFGSGQGFEVDLSEDAVGILTDQTTGDRYLYLDVTTVHGSSKNSFDIWAGPPLASANIPADVNARNLYIVNNPHSHDSHGVYISAIGILPISINQTKDIVQPVAYIPAEYAGQTVSLSLFDTDEATSGPLYFYFDTIAFDPDNLGNSDYYIVYGSDEDPERCFDSTETCDGTWVGYPGEAPAFTVQIPTFSDECSNPNDPTQAAICTPFNGGRLMARYQGGKEDTIVWLVNGPFELFTIPSNPTAPPYLPGQPFIYNLGYSSQNIDSEYTITITHNYPTEVTFTPALPAGHTLTGTHPAIINYSNSSIPTENVFEEKILAIGRVTDTLTNSVTLTFTTNLAVDFEGGRPDSITNNIFTRTVQIPELAPINNEFVVSEESTAISVPLSINPPNPYANIVLEYSVISNTATAGVDFELPVGTLFIPAGASSTLIEISLIDDLLPEVDESITVQLRPEAGGAIADQNEITITIQDNDLPTAMFSTSVLTVTEAMTNVMIDIRLDQLPSTTGTLTVTSQSGTAIAGVDFVNKEEVLVFTSTDITKTINVLIIDDDLIEENEFFTVILSGSNFLNIGPQNQITIHVLNDDNEKPQKIYLPLIVSFINNSTLPDLYNGKESNATVTTTLD